MEFEFVRDQALDFRQQLTERRELLTTDFCWYPYDSMTNIYALDALLSDDRRAVFGEIAGQTVADVGGADGDFAYFLEQRLGCTVDLIDYGPTNFNGLRGARRLRDELDSRVSIHEIDLDAQFDLPRDHYKAVFLLGLLYHLKNPFYALEALAARTELCFVSTRIAQLSPDHATKLQNLPVAYLLGPGECNNDATNFWIFSDAGLRRLFDRTGWDVVEFKTVGCTEGSDPVDTGRDERAFALLRSRTG
jgi:hypothetical protein